MEECAYNATFTKEIAKDFNKVMHSAPKSHAILHRTPNGKVEGKGDYISVKETTSNIELAHGNAALGSEILDWVSGLTPRESRTLSNGVDVVFLDQLLAAVEKLKTHPKLPYVCQAMANECHKPAPSIDVEMGEFLYGLADTYNIIKESSNKGMVAHSAFLDTSSGKKAKHVVGGHPSNFVVYVSPLLEAIALGWPSVILNHPQVPTAASHFIDLLEECGVDFTGKLVQATTSNIDELCKVFKGDNNDIQQGILIAGLNMGKTISEHAPNTKQELSGSNELVVTPEQYKSNSDDFIESLKMNLGYSAGKQCTAPSKVIFAGFDNKSINNIQSSLQKWSDNTKDMPARELSDFTSNVPYLFNNDQGNIKQFENNSNSFEPFVSGHRSIFKLKDDHKVDEVFGPATAFQFVDGLSNVNLSRHSLSMGINVDIASNHGRQSLHDFLANKDMKWLPSIINIGYNASTLAATPTGEAFLPWHYTLSGQDTGMGPHSPLRFSSFQVSNDQMNINTSHFTDNNFRLIVEKSVVAMKEHSHAFGSIDPEHAVKELISNAVESDKSLQPTLNGRVLDSDSCKMTLYMPLKIDEPCFIRLTNEDTPEIRQNMVAYALQWARQGVPVHISANDNIDNSILSAMEAACCHEHITVNRSNDTDFITSLDKKPQTIVMSDENFKVQIKNDNHFLTVFPNTKHTPFLVIGIKPQTLKVSGNVNDCITTLTDFIETRKNQSPVNITSEHIANQVQLTKNQVAALRKKLIIAKYQKYATPHYKGKVVVVADKTEGIRVIESNGDWYLDCNLAYGAAKAGFTPNLHEYNETNPNSCGDLAKMSVLPSQAMYTAELSNALERLSTRYAPVLKNPDNEIVQVMALNTGGEIMDSIQQACRRHGGPNTVVIYPRGNFNGRREHANKLNQDEDLENSFHENGNLNVDAAGRCFVEFNDPNDLERTVNECAKQGRLAAIIWEPVQGEGGIFVSSPEYCAMLNKLQAEGSLIVVADEVQTGFAGKRENIGCISNFLGVKPDVLALAKALTLGKVAASAAFIRSSLAKTMVPPGVDGGTFSGSPIACHCLLAADDFWHKTDALDRLYENGVVRKERIEAALVASPNHFVKAIKGIGSMGAVQFSCGPAAKHYHHLFHNISQPGVLHESFGHIPAGLKGIIQKLSGKDGSVMRMTSGLSPNQEDQELLTSLLCHLLSHPHYHPKTCDVCNDPSKCGC